LLYPPLGNNHAMPTLVRKAAWSGLYAGLSALATIAARRTAAFIWRHATGEAPPMKK
jgi:hypothetical protein